MSSANLHSEARETGTKNVRQFQQAVRYGILVIGALVAIGAITYGVSLLSFSYPISSLKFSHPALCPDISANITHACTLETKCTYLKQDATVPPGMSFCADPLDLITARKVGATTFEVCRTTDGPLNLRYKFAARGKCPASLTS